MATRWKKIGENIVHYAMFAGKCKADISFISAIIDELTAMTLSLKWPVLRKLADGVLDLLFPPRCQACHVDLPRQFGGVICRDCLDRVSFLASPLCSCCGQPLPPEAGIADRFCGECLLDRPAFDSARSLARYEPPVSTLLHRLKFHGDTAAAGALAELGKPVDSACDLILPVPLHFSRIRTRGLNQSLILAYRFFPAKRDKIVVDLLIRQKKTIAQTGLNGRQRRNNLKGAFAVTRPEEVRSRRISLVDDVYTTGTTLAECAKTLKKAGAASVHAWTVARAWAPR